MGTEPGDRRYLPTTWEREKEWFNNRTWCKNTGTKRKDSKASPLNALGCEGEFFSGPWKVQGGKTSGSEAAGQESTVIV
jgi:hypothetical protein